MISVIQHSARVSAPAQQPATRPTIIPSDISPREVLAELERVLASSDFEVSARNRAFLRYIVECSLKGHRPKGYDVAVEAFGRPTTFNSTTDPIVRIECGKLRKALEVYYLKSGRGNPLRLSVPKGSYRVMVERAPRHERAAEQAAAGDKALALLRVALLGWSGDRAAAGARWEELSGAYPSFPFDVAGDLQSLHRGDDQLRGLLVEGLRRAVDSGVSGRS